MDVEAENTYKPNGFGRSRTKRTAAFTSGILMMGRMGPKISFCICLVHVDWYVIVVVVVVVVVVVCLLMMLLLFVCVFVC